jgi:hypothetical protein
MGLLLRRLLAVVLAAQIIYTAYRIAHAVISKHPDTDVFWAAIGLLCLFVALQLGAINGIVRSHRPRLWTGLGGLLVLVGLLALI